MQLVQHEVAANSHGDGKEKREGEDELDYHSHALHRLQQAVEGQDDKLLQRAILEKLDLPEQKVGLELVPEHEQLLLHQRAKQLLLGEESA